MNSPFVLGQPPDFAVPRASKVDLATALLNSEELWARALSFVVTVLLTSWSFSSRSCGVVFHQLFFSSKFSPGMRNLGLRNLRDF